MDDWDDDSPRVLAVLLNRELLCVPCLSNRTGITEARIDRILTSLEKIIQVTYDVVVCDGCQLTREIFRLT